MGNERVQVNPQHILAVDDDDDVLHTLRELFQSHGYEVSRARNGYEAFRFLQNCPIKRPDGMYPVVFSDLNMPDWTGLKLLAKVRGSNFSSIPFILFSGFAGEREKTMAKHYEVDSFLDKPLSADVIIEKVKEAYQAFLERPEGLHIVRAPAGAEDGEFD